MKGLHRLDVLSRLPPLGCEQSQAMIVSPDRNPAIELRLHPFGHRYCSGMAGLGLQVDNGPVFFPLLNAAKAQIDGFMLSKTAREQNRRQRAVASAFQAIRVGCLP